jgi:hypothetical protein
MSILGLVDFYFPTGLAATAYRRDIRLYKHKDHVITLGTHSLHYLVIRLDIKNCDGSLGPGPPMGRDEWMDRTFVGACLTKRSGRGCALMEQSSRGMKRAVRKDRSTTLATDHLFFSASRVQLLGFCGPWLVPQAELLGTRHGDTRHGYA